MISVMDSSPKDDAMISSNMYTAMMGRDLPKKIMQENSMSGMSSDHDIYGLMGTSSKMMVNNMMGDGVMDRNMMGHGVVDSNMIGREMSSNINGQHDMSANMMGNNMFSNMMSLNQASNMMNRDLMGQRHMSSNMMNRDLM